MLNVVTNAQSVVAMDDQERTISKYHYHSSGLTVAERHRINIDTAMSTRCLHALNCFCYTSLWLLILSLVLGLWMEAGLTCE